MCPSGTRKEVADKKRVRRCDARLSCKKREREDEGRRSPRQKKWSEGGGGGGGGGGGECMQIEWGGVVCDGFSVDGYARAWREEKLSITGTESINFEARKTYLL